MSVSDSEPALRDKHFDDIAKLQIKSDKITYFEEIFIYKRKILRKPLFGLSVV